MPDLRDRLKKLKADREVEERKHSKEVYSTASNVEIIEEVRPIPMEIIEEIRQVIDAQEQGNNGQDSPTSPLARGLVPPYTGADTPEASEMEPESGVESREDGELSVSSVVEI